jgi:hypothetical protein
MKLIIGIVLMAITIFLNGKHAWSSLSKNMKPEETKMLLDIGLGEAFILPIGILSLAICLLILFPLTYFSGNLLNAIMILTIMALALNTGNIKIVLIEIPFLLLPLVMIWLGYPLKK